MRQSFLQIKKSIIHRGNESSHSKSPNLSTPGRDEIIKRLQEAAANFTGLVLRRKDPVKLEHFQTRKFGQFSDDEFITSISEFTVQVRTLPSIVFVFSRIGVCRKTLRLG